MTTDETAPLELDLSSAGISKLPKGADLQDVQSLDLSGNLLDFDAIDFSIMRHLRKLRLNATGMSVVPRGILELGELEVIELASNSLTALPRDFSRLARLAHVDLSYNNLERVPGSLARINVRHLDLGGNRLRHIGDEIASFVSLETLVLGVPTESRRRSNKLDSLPSSLGSLSALRALYVSSVGLRSIPAELGALARLELLDLTRNLLTVLPGEIGSRISDGLLVKLEGNPLRDPLPEFVRRGSSALGSYLSSLDDAEEQYEAKVLLVGEGSVGKTSLARRLTSEPFNANEPTTHGIEIRTIALPHPAQVDDLELHLWDFGGQEVYRITHQFFFSQRAVYLVTWNPRQGQEQNEVEGWIRRIRLRVGPNVYMLVVATHADERTPELDFPRLQTEYSPSLLGHYLVDSMSDRGLNELRKAMADAASRLPQMGQRLNVRWIAAKAAILGMAQDLPQASYWEVESVAMAAGMARGEVGVLLDLLHDLGHIIYYGSDDGLRDIVVLNPEWLTKAIGYVLEDTQTRSSSGVLQHSRLSRIWGNNREGTVYPENLFPYFLRLMEKFDVSYRIGDRSSQESLIAQLVPYERPALPWAWESPVREKVRSLRLVCQLTEPAPGIVAWLTVRHHRASTNSHWRTGFFLRHPIALYQSEALVEMLDERSLRIQVRAPSPDMYMNVLRESVEDLIGTRWPGLEYSLYVPCPGEHCIGRFNLKALLKCRDRRVRSINCSECALEFDVARLLTGFQVPDDTLQDSLDSMSARLQGVEDGVQRLAEVASASADNVRRVLRAIASEANDCPRLFHVDSITASSKVRGMVYDEFRLQLWCEHGGSWHATGAPYRLTGPRDWITRIAPYARLVAKTLQAAVPIAGAALGLALDEASMKEIGAEIEASKALVAALPGGSSRYQDELPLQGPSALTWTEGESLRAFRQLLFSLDESRRFRGLRRVVDDSGEFIWVCDEHFAIYDPGLPSVVG